MKGSPRTPAGTTSLQDLKGCDRCKAIVEKLPPEGIICGTGRSAQRKQFLPATRRLTIRKLPLRRAQRFVGLHFFPMQ
jgi:hypothetical protein